eukprot:4079066-Prymnesium_polylepis.1
MQKSSRVRCLLRRPRRCAAVATRPPPAEYEEADFTLVDISDAYELRNRTAGHVAIMQAAPATATGRAPLSDQKVVAGTLQGLAPGGVGVLRWEPSAPREIVVRPCDGSDVESSAWG